MDMPGLHFYVVYKNPSDFPGWLVLRRWRGMTPDPVALAISDSLEFVRDKVPLGCKNIGRLEGDDRAILEVWV